MTKRIQKKRIKRRLAAYMAEHGAAVQEEVCSIARWASELMAIPGLVVTAKVHMKHNVQVAQCTVEVP